MTTLPVRSRVPSMNRNLVVAGGVVLLHLAALWALQGGLLRRAVEVIVPAQVLTEFITPTPVPRPPEPRPPQRPLQPPPPRTATPQTAAPAPAVQAQPVAMADMAPAPTAPTGVVQAPAAPPIPVAAAATPVAPPAAPKIVLPSTDADYLNNPRPAYPPLSRRLGEQGKVIVRVLIGADGTAQRAEIRSSSGFERLDQAALATVLKWRYVPGRRDGVAEAMWFNVPIQFVLE